MDDLITTTMVNLYIRFGPGLLTLVSIAFFFGLTVMIVALEHKTNRYRDGLRIPFSKNFSTMIDFLILNPAMVVIAAYTTLRMQQIPDLLIDKVLLLKDEVSSVNTLYHQLLSTKAILPVAFFAASFGWLLYVFSARRKKGHKKGKKPLSLTGAYIAFATTVMMFIIISFTFRTFVSVWYLGRITRGGFVYDTIEWTVAIETISRLLVGVNWFYAFLSLVLVIFVLQDMVLNVATQENAEDSPIFPKPSLRIIGTLIFVVAIALSAIFGPLFVIHDNLLRAKVVEIEKLIDERRATKDTVVRKELAARIYQIKELRDWPLTRREGTLPVIGQVLALAASLVMKYGGEKWLRNRLSLQPKK